MRGGGDRLPELASWLDLVDEFLARGDRLLRTGALSLSMPDIAVGSAPPEMSVSAFHVPFQENAALRGSLATPSFSRFRLALNFTYLHLGRLGVQGFERTRLCHPAANAVEDVFGKNAFGIVSQFAARFPDRDPVDVEQVAGETDQRRIGD